jgi:uncharacterized protein YbjT (DUF2867 family)
MSVRKILVTGATGKQGSAVVNALVANPPPYPHEIVALTRNTDSPAAKKLAAKSKTIKLLTGDLNDCPSIFTNAGGNGSIWGVFSMQLPAMGQKNVAEDVEEKQGIALVDAALSSGVKHFVYSSVDRGGSNSINDPTNIGHFASKHRIELHLINATKDSKKNSQGMTYTILRPTAFYDNLTPDFIGKGFAAMWNNMGSVPLQLVGTRDIGVFAAMAFSNLDSDSNTYRNNAISLAGDELTQPEASKVFEKVFGKKMPITFGFVGNMIQYMMKELGTMFQWFVDVGYKADIAENKRLNPTMQNFETWLKEESKFSDKKQ